MFGQADFSERAAGLAERAESERPESWRPDKPELRHPNPLVGVLERVVLGPDRGYGAREIAELRDPAGKAWGVWIMGHVLEEEWRRQAPIAGELVAIRFEGRRNGANGEYRAYRLIVDRQEPPF